MPERDPNQDARQDQGLEFVTVYAPPFYPDRMEGPGRWVTLYAAEEPLGILWTNDRDGLGFLAEGIQGITRNAGLAHAFSKAKALEATATEVFEHYAHRMGHDMSAGPIQTGDLDALRD